MNIVNFGADVQKMSSREIAELTDKRHADVMRDIRNMLGQLELQAEGYTQNCADPQNGQMYPVFKLPKDLTLTLVAGYNVKLRKRIIDRWEALETGKAKPAMVAPVNLVHSYTDAVAGMEVVARMLRLEGSAALGLVRKATELTAPHLLPAIPVYAIDAPSGSGAGSSEPTASLSALMKANDIKGTAATMNVRLEMHGFLEKKTRAGQSGEKSFWSITEAGLKYGKNLTSPQNQRETQPHWYRDKFLDLMSTINAK